MDLVAWYTFEESKEISGFTDTVGQLTQAPGVCCASNGYQ